MKWLFYISLIFCFGSSSGQNLYTNAPDLVYPILEEFIAENFKRDKRSFYKINLIDSIVVRNIPLIQVEPGIEQKVYGYQHRNGMHHWIEIDSLLLSNSQKFEKTLNHELGHVFDLPHISPGKVPITDSIYNEIMCLPSLPYYIQPEEFRIAKENFYNSLIPLQNEKTITSKSR